MFRNLKPQKKPVKHLFFYSLMVLSLGLNAQVSGYLGKRMLLKVHGDISFTNHYPTPNQFVENDYGRKYTADTGINTMFGAEAIYLVNRKNYVLAGVARQRTGVELEVATLSWFANNANGPFDLHEYFYQLDNIRTSIGWGWFKNKKGDMAPFGKYRNFRLDISFINGRVTNKQTTYALPVEGYHRSPGIDPQTTYFALTYGFGRNFHLFDDRFIFSYGGQISIPIVKNGLSRYGSLVNGNGQPLRLIGSDLTGQEIFRQEATNRFMGFNALMFQIGIGYLVF